MHKYIITTIFIIFGILSVQANTNQQQIYIGDSSSTTEDSHSPFQYWLRKGVAQTIYLSNELGEPGLITDIIYEFRGTGILSANIQHKMWMAVTNKDEFNSTTDWIPFNQFTEVWSGTLPTNVSGWHNIPIILDTPFEYNGGNLVIMTQKFDATWAVMQRWRHTSSGGNRTLTIRKDEGAEFNPENLNDPSGTVALQQTRANITINKYLEIPGTLSGTVTFAGLPVEDVLIELAGTNRTTTSNALGQYNIPFILPDTYTIIANKTDFTPYIANDIIIGEGENVVHNISLTTYITVNVFGRIITSNTNLPLAGANISLSGYESFGPVTTLADGMFNITGVTGGLSYNLNISALAYTPASYPINVGITDYNAGDIIIVEMPFEPRNMNANVIISEPDNPLWVDINWESPEIPLPGINYFSHLKEENMTNSWGMNGPFTFTAIHRYTQEQLQNMGVSGHLLTTISFVPSHIQSTYSMRVWVGGSEQNLYFRPGTLVYSGPVMPASDFVLWEYNEYMLTTPVSIPTTGELWIGYETSHFTDGRPAGTSNKENIETGFADVINWYGTWTTLQYMDTEDVGADWLIKGKASVAANSVRHRTDGVPPLKWRSEIAGTLGYNVYRTTEANLHNPSSWITLASNIAHNQQQKRYSYQDYTYENLLNNQTYYYIVTSIFTNNNESEPVFSRPINKVPIQNIYIGDTNSSLKDIYSPVNYRFSRSMSQSIYYEEEIPYAGLITHLTWKFSADAIDPPHSTSNVQIWMSTSKQRTFPHRESWILFDGGTPSTVAAISDRHNVAAISDRHNVAAISDRHNVAAISDRHINGVTPSVRWRSEIAATLVWDAPLPVNKTGTDFVTIQLETPFAYKGDNLIITTVKNFTYNFSYHGEQNMWQYTVTDGYDRTITVQSPDSVYNPSILPDGNQVLRLAIIPNITLTMANTYVGGTISGTITSNKTQAPLAGVEVYLSNTNIKVFTNSNGQYVFNKIPEGIHEFNVTKHGYVPETFSFSFSEQQSITHNLTLQSLPTVYVIGSVKSTNGVSPLTVAANSVRHSTNGVSPLNDVIVTLKGFDNFETFTDNQGNFTFPYVYSGYTYTIRIKTDKYNTYTNDLVEVGDINIDLGDIILTEQTPSPRNVLATLIDDYTEISWESPKYSEEVQFSHASDISDTMGWVGFHSNFETANRFSVEQLADLGISGAKLTQIEFVPMDSAFEWRVRVYIGGTGAYNPGTMVVNQIAYPEKIGDWNTVVLENPIEIPEDKELWISYFTIHAYGSGPHALDYQPVVNGYGNLIWYNNDWWVIPEGNVMVRGIAEVAGSVSVISDHHRSGELRSPHQRRDAVGTYRLYRTNIANLNNPATWSMLADNINSLTFTDTTWEYLPIDEYIYIVCAIYSNNVTSVNAYSNTIIKTTEPIVPGFEIDIILETALHGNYPNPFNPSTIINYDIKDEGLVEIEIFNIRGQKIYTLVNEFQPTGRYKVEWSGIDYNSRKVSSGVYFYQMRVGNYTSVKRMVMMK